jgi:trans-aconitate methyltransferase
MSVAGHLGIDLREYDARIRTFIPRYEEMLDAAAAALTIARPRREVVVDLGIGSGALASRIAARSPRVRLIGIDSDEGILAAAQERLGTQLTPVRGDFTSVGLPRCDAISASFSLHHIRVSRRKADLYRRAFKALRGGGVIVNADCCPADSPRLRTRDRLAWREHLERAYPRAEAEGYLRAWRKEDCYFPLADEIDLLRRAGFSVDVPWRHDSFAVILGVKPLR